MDFAPYQSSPPEHDRALSPDRIASPRASWDYARRPVQGLNSAASPPPLQHPQPQRAWTGDGIEGAERGGDAGGSRDYFGTLGGREGMVSEFDTSLGIRLDYEACLAYIGLPPLGAIFLLIMERNSDYVRCVAFARLGAFYLLHPSPSPLPDLLFHLLTDWAPSTAVYSFSLGFMHGNQRCFSQRCSSYI